MEATKAAGSSSHWVHDLDPVIFQISDSLAVRWYGLAYVSAFLIGFVLLHLYWRRGRSPVGPAAQESLAMALILGVIIGGRLGYFLLYDFGSFISNPLILFQVWEGGMASHGGFAGVAVAGWWVARRHAINPLRLGDLIVSITAQGFFLGRLANFINGELWGKVSDGPWAVIFPGSAPEGWPVNLIAPRHPSQLYQAVLEGLLLFAVIQWRFWKIPGRGKAGSEDLPKSVRPGHLTGEFLILYSLARWVGEYFREPDAALIAGISRGSFYSLFLLLAGVLLVLWTRRGRLTNDKSA